MQRDDDARLQRQVVLLTVAVWTVQFVALVSSSAMTGRMTSPGVTLARFLACAAGAVCALLIHLVLQRRNRGGAANRSGRAVALSVPGAAVVSLVNQLGFVVLTPVYRESGLTVYEALVVENRMFLLEVVSTTVWFLWIFVAWAALYGGVLYAAEARQRERRVAAAESGAQQAQLMALRFQINPHFLFNTLNALSGLIGLGRAAEAERVLLNLSAFLRYSLSNTPQQLVTLKEEIAAQQMYLDIERVRFGERLTVRMEDSEELERALVPSLILQPLTENAVKYGVAPSTDRVLLEVSARRDGDDLVLAVRNSPPGDGDRTPEGTGIGLGNVERRLETLYGPRGRLRTRRLDDGGFEAEVRLPFTAGSAEAPVAPPSLLKDGLAENAARRTGVRRVPSLSTLPGADR